MFTPDKLLFPFSQATGKDLPEGIHIGLTQQLSSCTSVPTFGDFHVLLIPSVAESFSRGIRNGNLNATETLLQPTAN